MIDRSRLTKEEREELRRALVTYKFSLEATLRSRKGMIAKADARWRTFVVESLLAEVRD